VQPGFCGLVFDRGRVFAAAATATTKSFTANFRRQHADGILINDTRRIDARIFLFLFNNKRRNDVSWPMGQSARSGSSARCQREFAGTRFRLLFGGLSGFLPN
jgi:hypothetical protein